MGTGQCFRAQPPPPPTLHQTSGYLLRRMESITNSKLEQLTKLRTHRSVFFLENVSVWKVHIDTDSKIASVVRNIERVMELPNSPYILKPTCVNRFTRFRLAVRMPYCKQDFFDYLMDPYDVAELHKHLQHIANSIIWLHKHGLAHRDIKPENIVIDQGGTCRLIDFDYTDNVNEFSFCGTRYYAVTKKLVHSWGMCDNMAIMADIYSYGKMLLFCLFCSASHNYIQYSLRSDFEKMFQSKFVERIDLPYFAEPMATWYRVAMKCCRGTPPLCIPQMSTI